MLQFRPLSVWSLVALGCSQQPITPAPANPAQGTNLAAGANSAAQTSSIQSALQTVATEELNQLVGEKQPEAATILVLSAETGEIVANAGVQQGQPSDVALKSAFITGSTFKTITLAAALETGVIQETDSLDCENGTRTYPEGKTLHDSKPNGVLTVPELLAVSSNVGFSKIFDRLGGARLIESIQRFHLGVPPPIPGAISGSVPDHVDDGSFRGGVLASGELATATPLQMAAAYSVFANNGYYVPPTLTRRVGTAPRERVLSERTNSAVLRMLGGAVNSEQATGKAARVQGVQVAGKTGTADLGAKDGTEWAFASFIGIVPADRPRFVIFVGALVPNAEGNYGGALAAPVFARVAARALSVAP